MRVDWKDDIFTGDRKYNLINNSDGTVSMTDATEYTQQGDAFGAKELNEIGAEVNKIQAMKNIVLTASGWSSTAPYTQTVEIDGITESDLPVPLLDVSGAESLSEEKAMKKQFGWISYYDTDDGSITFTAKYRKPTMDLSVGLKGVS